MSNSRKIKILFDAGPLVNGHRSGVGKTTEGLVLALANDYPDQVELVGHYFDFLGRKKAAGLPAAPNIRYRRTVLIPGKVFNMLRRLGVWVPFELLAKERGDFHVFPGFIGWPSLFGTPHAPFVHDVTYIDYPEYVNSTARYDLQKIMPRTVRNAAFIITNSESSKQGITKYYKLDKTILVEHIPGVNVVKLPQDEADKRIADLGIVQPFLFFLGNMEPRKNLVGLVRAYELLDKNIRDKYALVLAGQKGWNDEEIVASISRLKESGANVIQTGYVSDEDRAALFMNASIYLMPSHYEGFGMQLLEGMDYGTPMIATDIPVLHEVAQGAALYCQTSPEDIAAKITHLLGDTKLQQQLVEAGRERLKDFSWHKVSKDIFEQIQKVTS